nr:PhzF family phenazine biosynthesis isomerase [uncultured Deefgea sp.]
MPQYNFHIFNVFAEKPRSGDPLIVFNCDALPNQDTCQALAYQMGGVEVAFFSANDRRLMCFTPQHELPTSGRALLGVAALLHHQDSSFKSAIITTEAGPTTVEYASESSVIICPTGSTRPCDRGHIEVAQALDISAKDIINPILFVDSGLEQLMIQVRSRQSVLQARPHPALLTHCLASPKSLVQATIWSIEHDLVTLRCFSADPFQIIEDFGSGIAAANIASYLIATGAKTPLSFKIEQGHTIQKLISPLSIINVKVDLQLQVHVSGKVNYLGKGIIEL